MYQNLHFEAKFDSSECSLTMFNVKVIGLRSVGVTFLYFCLFLFSLVHKEPQGKMQDLLMFNDKFRKLFTFYH